MIDQAQREEILGILDGRVHRDPHAMLDRIRQEVAPRAARGATVNASVILAILDGEA